MNIDRRSIITEDGQELPIVWMADIVGDECDDAEDAATVHAGPDRDGFYLTVGFGPGDVVVLQ